MTLRSHFITRWNRHCTRILEAILPVLEKNRSLLSHECHNQLADIKTSYKVNWYICHVGYSDLPTTLFLSWQDFLFMCGTLIFNSFSRLLKGLVSTCVKTKKWSMLWQSTFILTQTTFYQCGFTLCHWFRNKLIKYTSCSWYNLYLWKHHKA